MSARERYQLGALLTLVAVGALTLTGCPAASAPASSKMQAKLHLPAVPAEATPNEPAKDALGETTQRGDTAGNDPQPAGDQIVDDPVMADILQVAAQAAEAKAKAANPNHPFPQRVQIPDFSKDAVWLNSEPLTKQDLKGKFVLLDFWTYCCINCIHILPELKKLERQFPNNLVVIGVHSAKFTTEKETDNIREAILRYEIEHPVINDAD